MVASRVEQLERTVLELGTEMFRLKAQISELTNFHEQFSRTIKGLKQILDDKGLITSEDFESAVELGEALNILGSVDTAVDAKIEDLKKTRSH